jgi:hypothetical protein
VIDAFGMDLTAYRIFFGAYLLLVAFAAFAIGQALANTWRPVGALPVYAVLLGIAHRFLVFALFHGKIASIPGFVVDTLVLALIAYAAFRMTRAHRMVTQYPWLYVRAGPFSWHEKSIQ